MKILHIAPIGHHAEGIGGVLIKLVPEQIKLGHDVRVISVYNNLIYKDINISTITEKKVFESYINAWTPDIVIFHSHFHKEYIVFSKILISRTIPYCVQLHGALSKTNYKKNKFKKFVAGLLMFNKILKHAATIIYLNHSEYINSIVPRFNKRFAIIPNGCDKHNDIDIERPLNDPLKIVFIGRIAFNHKGLDILLEAITSMNNAHKNNVHFYFYGNEDDSGTELLKEMVDKLDIASYEGPIYGIEKEKLLRNTDIFILTSRYEGMPMGVLEAWSYGVPCILTEGTNMTGIDVNKYAYWKTNFDSKQIAATIKSAIKDLSANPQLYRIESIQEAQKYSWTNIASESIEVYKNRCKV